MLTGEKINIRKKEIAFIYEQKDKTDIFSF